MQHVVTFVTENVQLCEPPAVARASTVSLQTDAVAVVVSESSIVRIFDEGEIVSSIIPELWLLKRHGLDGVYSSGESGGTVHVREE